jgi:predicted NAD/FAD-dependent oxidoreductase
MSRATARVAIVGAGMAGASCARMLNDAGFDVQLFDKSRGVGGRMATRRVGGSAGDALPHGAAFDHGAPGFSAHSPDFTRFADQAHRDGLLARWLPTVAPGSYAPLADPALWVPSPDMPSLCRGLLAGLPVHGGRAIDALRREAGGWCLESAGATVVQDIDAVVVAIPPPQAAALLRPHRADWAQQAQSLPMLPGWTLMAVTADSLATAAWDLAWPTAGPLSWIVRNDAKPGRQRMPGLAHWVAHATAPWSQMHLESPAAEVQAALQDALAGWLGQPLDWQHAAVHRWRYASVPRATASAGQCWWDARAGLGMCGDALGGAGVEGAWLSARALATALIEERGAATSRSSRHPFEAR